MIQVQARALRNPKGPAIERRLPWVDVDEARFTGDIPTLTLGLSGLDATRDPTLARLG